MQNKTQVIVIGGGIIGCNVLYHLAKLGWTDVTLMERKVLTAGSTWHAAAGFHSLNGDPNISRLQAYSISVYDELEHETDQHIGIHRAGGLVVAGHADKWELLQADAARHKVLGIETELLGPGEIRELCPIIDHTKIKGGIYDPTEGHIDPHGVTHALAKAARAKGAKVIQQCKVESMSQNADGSWVVQTNKGEWYAEHIVNAGGLWAREVGHMAGVNLPLVPFEHHYIVSDPIPEIKAMDKEMAVVAHLDGEIYMRQEGEGVLFGVYEKNPFPWSVDGTRWDYGETDLLPPRLEHLEENLINGFEYFPALSNAGIKRIVNGPFTFTPDGNPLVGPVRGLRNYWSACGCMAGFSQGGGVGLALAQWMIDGAPEMDVEGMDVERFGEFATQQYTVSRGTEFYEKRFALVAPNESWDSARPCRVTPLYQAHKDDNAVFMDMYGQEVPVWYAPKGEPAIEVPSFRRSNAFPHVGDEVKAVREAAGVFEISGYAKYRISGPKARRWLNQLLACRLPKLGHSKLAPMLSDAGMVIGDLTVSRLSKDVFWLTGSGRLQNIHMRWFEKNLPDSGVHIDNITDSYGGLSISGPKAQEIVQKLTRLDLSTVGFMSVVNADVAMAPATLIRISLTGERGYEIYVQSQYMQRVYAALREAGDPEGLKPFGVWALMSLRMEKGYGIWGREFTRDDTPEMCGLDYFVDLKKDEFIGKAAMMARKGEEPARKLMQIIIDTDDCDALGYEPVYQNDELVGYTTSGSYGFTVGESLSLAYIYAGTDLSKDVYVNVMGKLYQAKIQPHAVYDPKSANLRG